MPTTRKGRRDRTALFLYTETGGGHRTAAQAIDSALQRLAPALGIAIQSRLVDVVSACGHFPLRESILSYGAMLKVRPSPYAAIYHLSNGRKRYRVLGQLGKPFIIRKFRQLVADVQPDVVVSVHPLFSVLSRQTIDSLRLPAPLVVIVTDLVSIHHSWTAADAADHYVVASPEAAEVCAERDIPPAKIHDLGLPIREGFAPAPADRARSKLALGLDARRRTLLVMAGGEGGGRIPRLLPDIAPTLRALDVQIVAVAGKNAALRRKLLKMGGALGEQAKVFGFLENIAEYMQAADALLTKAGPGTIAEAAASALPIVVCDYISGQEAGNLEYVRRRGSGIVAMDAAALGAAVQRLFSGSDDELERLRHAALASARPDAAADIARLLVDAAHLALPEEPLGAAAGSVRV